MLPEAGRSKLVLKMVIEIFI